MAKLNPPPAAAPTAPASSVFGVDQQVCYGAGSVGVGMVFVFANAALPFYLASYGLPNALIGFLAQERPPAAGVLQFVVGALSDRTRSRLGRRRPYIVFGIPIAALALLALALHPPVWLMVAALVVMTSGLAIGYGPYLALLPDRVPEDQRGRVGGVLTLASTAGQLIMLGLAAQLWATNEALIFAVVASGLLLGMAVTVAGVSETRDPAALPPLGQFRPIEYLRGLLEQRECLKYLVASGVFWLGNGAVMPFLTRFGTTELQLDEPAAFALLMVATVSTTCFALPAGWLADYIGKKPVLFVGLIAFGVALIVGSQTRTVDQAILALAFSGAANALCMAVLFPLLADLIPKARAGEFTGLGTGVWELTQPIGAVLAGTAADITGSLRGALVVAALLMLVAGLMLTTVRVPPHVRRPG